MSKRRIALVLVILIGFFLRFFALADIPPSLSHDEVAIGYNAYSILKTGKDEYGTSFPVLFRSFDDYKLPGMVYATVPSIALFGLNEFGVRFPSALFGALAILVFYGIAKRLVRNQSSGFWQNTAPVIVTFFFAISPWHINFSRQAFESNGALFFFMLGTYFLMGFEEKPLLLLPASIFYTISFYFYYSVRTVVPAIILGFIYVYRKQLATHIKTVVLSALLGLILILPILPSMFTSGGLSRIQMVSVVNDPGYADRRALFARKRAVRDNFVTKALYNNKTALLITVIENYFKNLSLKHIFVNGTGRLGLLYRIELPLFLVGLYVTSQLSTKQRWLILTWFAAFPLSGAFSVDQPNALRTLLGAPVLVLFSGLGAAAIIQFISTRRFRVLAIGILTLLLVVSVAKFCYLYFYFVPHTQSKDFGDGYKQMIQYVNSRQLQYTRIYISGYYWRPYIFFLFWKQYDPQSFQQQGSWQHIDNYFFTSAEWDKEGVFIYNSRFRLSDLDIPDPKHTLFLLATPEYRQHQDKFKKIDTINGRFAQKVFVSAELSP